VLDPVHRAAVPHLKRKAFYATPADRLAQLAPESETLLDRAFSRGISRHSDRATASTAGRARSGSTARHRGGVGERYCIVTLLDRLLHHADVTKIEGESYRLRESELETARRKRK
jgi:hypothetical protein